MKAIIGEASQDGIALFIDELHSIVGAGGARGSGDIASLLKPALARGEIACIAATTDEEYRRYIEDDPALERRFAPILVREPTVAQTIEIVRSHRDALARLRGVAIDDDLLGRIVRFAGDAMPDRRYPDKAIELLEQVVAHAVAAGATTADGGRRGRRGPAPHRACRPRSTSGSTRSRHASPRARSSPLPTRTRSWRGSAWGCAAPTSGASGRTRWSSSPASRRGSRRRSRRSWRRGCSARRTASSRSRRAG